MPHYALIALGANVGDPTANIEKALRHLNEVVLVVKVSSFYKTRAVGGPADQQDFINAAAEIIPNGPPRKTMEMLLEIELKMGRVRTERWGPRVIDLDLLDQDGEVIHETDLEIPHPRIGERAFVLMPLNEIAPDWRHPVTGKTAGEMLDNLSAADRAVIISVGAVGQPPLQGSSK